MLVVLDLEAASWWTLPPLKVIKQVAMLVSVHYPSRLGVMYLTHVSSTMHTLWLAVRTVLPEDTRRRVRILSGPRDRVQRDLDDLLLRRVAR